jgi:steroid delta-isomerase-like uncharacterized protein
MLALLADGVAHDINQGAAQHGKPAFAAFLDHMARCYREELRDIVIMAAPDGSRAAAEFRVEGQYLATDEGLPPAHGQRYSLPAGAFYALRDDKITRVTVFYNLQDWLRQVGR